MSKMLKAILNWFAPVLRWIGNYFLEAASFSEVEKEVVVHTAQLTARPAPKEEVVPIAKSRKLKKPRKPREKSLSEKLKHGESYAWTLLRKKNGKPFSGREISVEVGLDRSTFRDAQGKNPKKTEGYFVLFVKKNPKHPLLKEKEVQQEYFDLTGKKVLIKPTPSFQIGELDKLEFPKESKEPKDLMLGLIQVLCGKEPIEYRRPSFTQEHAANLLGKGRCILTNAKKETGGKERLIAAEDAARRWAEDYKINVEKTWPRMERISSSVTDIHSVTRACKKEGLKLHTFLVFWIQDIVYQNEAFRDMFPTVCKKMKTTVHKDIS